MKLFLILAVVIGILFTVFSVANQKKTLVFPLEIFQSDEVRLEMIRMTAWLWVSPERLRSEEMQNMLVRAQEERISTIYVYADDVLAFFPVVKTADPEASARWNEKTKEFIAGAHHSGIKIHALGGAPKWAYRQQHTEALNFFEYILLYNRSVGPEERFDGIQFDIEPYGQDNYPGNETKALQSYMEGVRKILEKYDGVTANSEAPFELGFAVPYWFDGEDKKSIIALEGMEEKKGVSLHLLDMLNTRKDTYMAIMDYRNVADGIDGSIAHARGEMEYAAAFAPNVSIFIGQEITDVLPAKVTFHGKGKEALKTELKKITKAFGRQAVFGGFAIHTLERYVEFE